MKIVNFSESNSILNQNILEIRDMNIQQDRMRFRRNIVRIGEIMAYEISKTLDYTCREVDTCLGKAKCNVPKEKIVLATLLRAGLLFHEGFLNVFEDAENAFISAYRQYTDDAHKHFEVHTEYLAAPSVEGKTLIIVDPMLATGSSLELAIQSLLTHGKPKRIILAAVIAAKPAFLNLQKFLPEDTEVYCATVDPILNEHAYIVPGLGDAGDLMYGEKL